MSKNDSMRAMREARYAAKQATPGKGAPRSAARPAPASTETPAAATKPAKAATESPAPATAGLCGHRNMGGRTCTREAQHAAKSHRYS